MPGMQTKLHAVINRVGAYEGFSANYSGAGFSGMRFAFHGMEPSDFDRWVGVLRNAEKPLTRAAYLELERPSENVPVQHFASVDPALFKAVLNMCVEPGKMCMSEMAAIDSRGGLGLAGIDNVIPRLAYDKFERRGAIFGPPSSYVAGICTIDELTANEPRVAEALPADLAPLLGAGLQRPGFTPARLDTTLLRSPAIPDRNS
jgi:cytochrome o ubiquinol oxidase subunit 2